MSGKSRKNSAEHTTITVEHFTPTMYIEAAREALGGRIDVDPASCSLANTNVKATKFFSIADDGLSRPWGTIEKPTRVYCNPPGGRLANQSVAALWWAYGAGEWVAGRVEMLIWCVFNPSVFQVCIKSTPKGLPCMTDAAICYPSERVDYLKESDQLDLFGCPGEPTPALVPGGSPPHPSAFLCLPAKTDRAAHMFHRVFEADRANPRIGPVNFHPRTLAAWMK